MQEIQPYKKQIKSCKQEVHSLGFEASNPLQSIAEWNVNEHESNSLNNELHTLANQLKIKTKGTNKTK